jgi:aspartyl-tRNA(Asn)/glutamyl-tRNA(Gln) amidotransferase subunit A
MDGIWITELAPRGDAPRLAVKDLFDTAGVRTTYGSAVFAEHVPSSTAEAVLRLERAGYANVGKTNLHEFAYGVTSQNAHYGTVPNPRAPGRTAGGSSGGSAAAVVAGLADVALGTDSGGSIRIPAACCGIVGFKPTYGLVSTDGVFPLAPSFDHVGPMAADVAGCAAMMRALAPELPRRVLESLEEVSLAVAWDEPRIHARGRRRAPRAVRGACRALR